MRVHPDWRQRLPVRYAKQIEALWMRRNTAPESELDAIDDAMFRAACQGKEFALNNTPRRIVESHNMHGIGHRRHAVFVLPGRTDSKQEWDYWSLVTDVPCPCCPTGTIRWHEAGYVPGWRICDGCKRTFQASGDMRHPKLILD